MCASSACAMWCRCPRRTPTEYASAVVRGTVAEVTDDAERIAALQAIAERYAAENLRHLRPPWLRSFHARSCGKITPTEITAKAASRVRPCALVGG